MAKLRFDPSGATGHAVGFDETGTHDLPKGAKSTLLLRYVLQDGAITDQYAGLTDEEAVAEHARRQAAGAFQPPGRPSLVLTEITSDTLETEISADRTEVTCPVGSVLTVTAEFRQGDEVLPVTEKFRMPLKARDGRERILLVSFVDGVAHFTATMGESGTWTVDQATLNADLPSDRRFQFTGLKAFVHLN